MLSKNYAYMESPDASMTSGDAEEAYYTYDWMHFDRFADKTDDWWVAALEGIPTLSNRRSANSQGNDIVGALHILADGIQQAADFVDNHPVLLVVPAIVGMAHGQDGPLEEELTDLEGAASGRLQTVYNSFKGFVGSLRAPLEDPYVVGRNVPETIKGTFYTGHALDTMQQYGIPTSVVEDALTNGTMDLGNQALTFTFTSQNVVVVTNAAGGVITVIPK
jgi:hypothetical protein